VNWFADDVAGGSPGDYALHEDHLVVVRKGRESRYVLTDPGDPLFLRLPRIDLADGTPLRRAAFATWARAVKATVAGGVAYESVYRARRPLVTWLTMLGAATICAVCSILLFTWAFRPKAGVTIEPTAAEAAGWLIAVALVVSVVVLAFAALLRAWHCRRGSYVHVGASGIRTRHGGPAEPLSAVAGVSWHPFVRCTRIQFADRRPALWVPADGGVMRRPDLLLAALDDRLGAAVR
jgi:hypothetical protein